MRLEKDIGLIALGSLFITIFSIYELLETTNQPTEPLPKSSAPSIVSCQWVDDFVRINKKDGITLEVQNTPNFPISEKAVQILCPLEGDFLNLLKQILQNSLPLKEYTLQRIYWNQEDTSQVPYVFKGIFRINCLQENSELKSFS